MSNIRTKHGNCLPHHIARVVAELDYSYTCLDIPKHTGHVSGRSNDLPVVDEATATEVTRVRAKLTSTPHIHALFRMEVVYRANVIETTASDIVARW